MPLTKTTSFLSDDDIAQKEKEFRAKRYALSYSSEKTLGEDPQKFYREKVLGIQKKVHKKAFDEGHLVHSLILEPHKVNSQYVIQEGESGLSDNQRKIIEDLLDFRDMNSTDDVILSTDMEEWKPIILQILKKHDLFQKMGDEKKLERIINEKGKKYWDTMLINRNKIVVTQKQMDEAKAKVENFLKNGKAITDKMGLTDGLTSDDVFVMNEKMFYLDRPSLPFDEKGILDNFCVHFTHEKIYVNDVKTTGGSLTDFQSDIRRFKYFKQGAKYYNLAEAMKADFVEKEPAIAHYPIEFRFVVLDKNGYFGAYKISDETMAQYREWHEKDLKKLRVHFDNWDFSTPTKFLNNFETVI